MERIAPVDFILPTEILPKSMMKKYHLYVFTQESCPPCTRLKDHVKGLTADEQSELDFVPFRTATGSKTALAEEYGIEMTPTLVVVSLEKQCEEFEGDWYANQTQKEVHKVVGANDIIKDLPSSLDSYTYAHPE